MFNKNRIDMKKNNFLVVVLIVAFSTISTTGFSQIKFGLRGEVGLNNPKLIDNKLEVDYLNTFRLGPTLEVMLPGLNFGVEASVLYNNDRMDVRKIDNNETVEVTNHYIDIPLNLKYKFGLIAPIKIYAAGGPYAKIHIDGGNIKFAEVQDEIKSKNFEAGINLGIGAELFTNSAGGVNYGINLTDNYSVNKPEWGDALNDKKGTWSVGIAFYL